MPKRISIILATIAVALTGVITGCKSSADTVSDNLSKDAEKFNVQRKIVGINGITDKVLFEVDGRCSLENGDTMSDVLDVICKHGPNDYRKHYIGLSDNVTFISTQTKGLDESEYRTKIVLKPENLVPDLDLVTGERP